MSKLRQWLPTGSVVVLIAVVVAVGWTQRDRFAPIQTGSRAPVFAAAALDGRPMTLEDFRGRVVVLNIWATWCGPCRYEMPALERLHRALGPAGLEVVAVSVDALPGSIDRLGRAGGDVRHFVAEYGLTFRVLHDPTGSIQDLYPVVGLPTTFLIGRDGRIREVKVGPAAWDEPPYSDRIRRLLES